MICICFYGVSPISMNPVSVDLLTHRLGLWGPPTHAPSASLASRGSSESSRSCALSPASSDLRLSLKMKSKKTWINFFFLKFSLILSQASDGCALSLLGSEDHLELSGAVPSQLWRVGGICLFPLFHITTECRGVARRWSWCSLHQVTCWRGLTTGSPAIESPLGGQSTLWCIIPLLSERGLRYRTQVWGLRMCLEIWHPPAEERTASVSVGGFRDVADTCEHCTCALHFQSHLPLVRKGKLLWRFHAHVQSPHILKCPTILQARGWCAGLLNQVMCAGVVPLTRGGGFKMDTESHLYSAFQQKKIHNVST